MLKLLFWTLLGINAVLFAYGQGLLGSFKSGEREPERIRNQLNVDQLQWLSAAAAAKVQTPPAPAPAEEVASAASADSGSCTEIGNFARDDVRRFENLVAPLGFGERQSRVDVSVQEITQHMVMIPPLPNKDAADRKAAELKEKGVSNYFIINDSGPLKWAISLGVFKSEAAAQTLLAALRKQGVAGARVAGRSSQVERVALRFRGADAEARAKLDAAAATFAGVDTRECK